MTTQLPPGFEVDQTGGGLPDGFEIDRKWADVPGEALRNLPKSAGEFAHAMVQPIIHPIDTAKGVGSVLAGLEAPQQMVKVTLPNGQTVYQPKPVQETQEQTDKRTAPAKAVGDFFSERYGSMDGFKKAIATDPVGVMADFATVLTGGSTAAARAPGVAGKAAQIAGTVGKAIDPINAVTQTARGVGKVGDVIASNALGFTTGAGADAVRTAARAGQEGNEAFRTNMRGQAPMTDIVDMADEALSKMGRERAAAYNKGMVAIRDDASVLDLKPVVGELADTASIGSFKGVPLSKASAETWTALRETIANWAKLDPAEFHTPAGFDALKQSINEIRLDTKPGSQSRIMADRVYNSVRDQITAQAPTYAKTMKDYGQASDAIKEIKSAFSLNEKASKDTQIRKLQSVTRNNVQTNYGQRVKLAEELNQRSPDLMPAIAGQAFNSLLPRGLMARGAALMSLPSVAALPAFMPRAVGEAAYAAGAASRPFSKIDPELLRRMGLMGYQAGHAGLLNE